jgi:8-oxo-dGTP pyrophosphatase MutT (NUDIX family)
MKRLVAAVLLNELGQILSVSRKTNHSDFGLPGGKVDPEDGDDLTKPADPEVLEKAIRREVMEETGYEIYDLELVDTSIYRGDEQYTYIAKYRGEINTTEPHVVKWTHYAEIMAGTFGDYNEYLANILRQKGISFAMN